MNGGDIKKTSQVVLVAYLSDALEEIPNVGRNCVGADLLCVRYVFHRFGFTVITKVCISLSLIPGRKGQPIFLAGPSARQ